MSSQQPTRPRRGNGAIIGAVMMLVSLTFTLAAAEFAVRIFAPQITYRHPVGIFKEHPERVYTPISNYDAVLKQPEFTTRIKTNNVGLRNDYDIAPKDESTLRVLVVGDSFTAAYGVKTPQTWTEVLADEIEKLIPGKRVEVLNAGVPGYNTAQENDFFDNEGTRLDPDLTILGFFYGNDIGDNATGIPDWVIDDGYLRRRNPPAGVLPFGLRSFIAKRSQLYHLVWPAFRALTAKRHGRANATETSNPIPPGMGIYAEPAPQYVADGWEATRVQLERFAQISAKLSIPAIVVGMPDGIQIGAPRTVAGRTLPTEFPSGFDPATPNKKLAELCEKTGLAFFDLLQPLASQPDPGALYFPLDGHWTVTGNKVVGQTLAPIVARELTAQAPPG